MARRVGLGDTALLIDEMMELRITSHVNNHRIAVLFGHLLTRLPVGEIAVRAHLTSLHFGSAAMIMPAPRAPASPSSIAATGARASARPRKRCAVSCENSAARLP
jgi:hypothetical protein